MSRLPKNFPIASFINKHIRTYDKKHKGDKLAYDLIIDFVKKDKSNRSFKSIYTNVNLINSIFKTRIGDTFEIAKNIKRIKNFDKKLKKGDPDLMKYIGKYTTKNNNKFLFYSFATKYCHCHYNDKYPIYDQYVAKSLVLIRNKYKTPNFKWPEKMGSLHLH